MVPVRSPLPYSIRCHLSHAGPGGVSVVSLRGDYDSASTSALSETLAQAVALGDSVVIELSGVEFISSGAVGVLVRTDGFLRQRSRSLTIHAPSPSVRRIFSLCGLSNLLDRELPVGAIDSLRGDWASLN